MARRIGVFSTGDLPFILVSGVEEMKCAHSAVPYETHYGLMTYHEEQFIIITVTVKYDNEKEERIFTVNFNAHANRQALKNFAKGAPIWFTAADAGFIKDDMLGAEIQLELMKHGCVHITPPDPLVALSINTFLEQHQ
ncbi:hypothetical protein HFE03_07040 [Paenibacillus sp. EKM102P]|uniref:hypothetical protein n=1 Tax=unclassified Paenibacillus TaxID=185978 RepID=UPI00142D2709|nr:MULTISPECIES: hypothetical protein [unclassified Paenibacillus]KAF6620404.1 hypothetical protein HFE00_04945 [Paenibacillus sp. EKM101P]KAF6623396.1 hypothetical protein HFE03_07040 [Paenibacillus sp. EKM102P]KAF6634042.1 hypothetical protein HFE01_07470 [Paenibacillus sp. EKM10P]KAF6649568.1 hypothetical protein HFE02_02430 [Paenibacillus sp. EKM11P]